MILLTGNRGFIGRHASKRFPCVGYDLLDSKDIREPIYAQDIDIIVHMAARTGARGGELDPESYISTNVEGTRNLLKFAKENGVKHFIYFSSASVYGESDKENKETNDLRPINLYGQTKVDAEKLVRESGVPYTIIRPFNVYGENGRPDMVIFKWLNQIKNNKPISFYGDGDTYRSYTYVGDLLDGLEKVIELGPQNEIYNFGGGTQVKLHEMLDIFEEVLSFKVEKESRSEKDIPESWANIEKAKGIGYNPTTEFKSKLLEIIKQEI